ncbi:double zinc ribbon and ankyrin repeat-containing protein 1 isoform X1 [Solea senegalensis]|uniref:Double zinc ribbon and ankyrin repeat-containing protein 1 isoform X1 n=1 Tax=Solea senegalensis TaxID=28829 RepID=A0AAV6QA47_SOLSE|nr:double zinc ribbon and ankyrin repeat-containing protein 1 isoform X1 [Solea senegalensis]
MTAGSVSAPLIIPIIHLHTHTHRAKNHIDTNTPVSVHSDSPHVVIFYTLDGSRPVSGHSLERRGSERQGLEGRSHRYSEPLLLPAGRVTVRAVAVSRDGRLSSVVTKVFSVDLVDSDNRKQTEQNFLLREQQVTDRSVCSRQNSSISSLRRSGAFLEAVPDDSDATRSPGQSSHLYSEQSMMGNDSQQSGPRFLTHRPVSLTTATSATSGVKQLSSSNMSHNDFLRCPQCLSLRPSDPFARFCSHCGAVVPALPEQRLPPAEGEQVVCDFCNNVVPVNAHTCLICDAPVQSQARVTLQDHVVCVSCGSGNPGHMTTCLTCESHLQQEVCNSAPSVPSAHSRMLSCSRCKRLNHSDARFCDWCGCQPGPASSCTTCWRCGAGGQACALYCATCGVNLDAPAAPTSCSDITGPAAVSASHDATWQATPSPHPTPTVRVAPPTTDQWTQTIGLYYPSAIELHRKEQQRTLQLTKEQTNRDRQPPLTAVSPGRGYWRKQLDHVCAHLRSYTQNNAPFRTLLGEPRLGRVVSAVIEDDGCEVTLSLIFVSAAHKLKVRPEDDGAGPAASSVGPAGGASPAGWTESLSNVTERFDDGGSLRSDRSTAAIKRHKMNLTPKPAVKDIQLFKELAPGRGHVGVVQQLLDLGADPCCCGSDGRHALAVAVVNGHHDVIPVLVQRGADVNQRSGRMKNTALHEAAAQGSEGLKGAQVLLSCRASARRRNACGQTAYDVAVTSGSNDMTSLLAAQTGLHLLDKLRKSKLNLDVT